MVKEPFVDVCFKLRGEQLPLDHGYPLYAAVSNELPEIHRDNAWGIHPVYGEQLQPGVLELLDESRLKIRLPANAIEDILPLAGSTLDVEGDRIQVGVPEVRPLSTAESIKSRYVTIKGFMEPGPFADAVGRQLSEIEVEPEDTILEVGDRRVMEIDGYTIVGFKVRLGNLTTDESLAIQREGIGGRRKMGAGIFRPANGERD